MLESQEEANATLRKFQDLLRQLFQFDSADLDFGIYRILNYKRREIDEFIAHRLPQIVEKAFEGYAQTERESLQKRIEETKKKILENLGKEAFDEHGQLVKFHETPLGKEYTALLEELAHYQIGEDLKIRVYNDLYTFFSRYYEDGDFIAKRRYGRDETYAIPYNGEEVVLHWATKDQYYIKTGERFRNYRFKVQNYTIAFELRNATAEQNNNKGEKRYFVLAKDNPVVLDPKTKTLTVFFEYRTLADPEQKEFGRTEQQKPQDNLNKKTANVILEWLRDLASKDPKASEDSKKELENLKAQLEKPEAANEQSRLMKHLTRFTRRNTSDFFIHKDLRGFLRRELDFFIKSQSLLLDELLAQDKNLTHQHIQRARVIRDIGYKIIDFLAQVEDFQKKLFEKKKFVIRTEYCLTIDRVPEDLWDEVLGNRAQLAEWRELYGVDPQPTKGFLRQHPALVVDTRHFSEDFKWRLLAHFDDLDEALDGVLIKSENFQALNLLMERYKEQVKCIYIDPPYNTGNDGFLYKDRYQHSSWLSMMADRLALARETLRNDGVIFVSIDDNEVHNLRHLMDVVYGSANFEFIIEWQARKSVSSDALLSYSHNHLLLYAKDKTMVDRQKAGWRLPMTEGKGEEFANPDNDPRGPWKLEPLDAPEIRPNLEYPIVNPKTGKAYLPTKGRHWRFPKEEMDRLLEEGRIVFGKTGKGRPALKRYLSEIEERGQVVTTWWDDVETTADGTKLLQDIMGEKTFNNPKPVGLIVRICQLATRRDDIVLDFFAGSGTTAHAVINLNREDSGRRKYILVEVGDYFETVLLPRIKKVVYSDNWKGGKPQEGKGTSHFIKYLYLEQYEDTLNNLELPRKQEGQVALEWFGDEYLLRYMLDFETQGSPSLLNPKQLQDPFAYKLKVQGGDEIREHVVDLVETFNYLLGIHVKKMRQFQDNGRLYRAVLGEKDGKRIVIVWRPLKGLIDDPGDAQRDQGLVGNPGNVQRNKDSNRETPALQRDGKFIQNTVLPALLGEGMKPDRLLVNGICYVPDAEPIEPEFKRLMWKEGKDG
jgi:adenine-specific DNA-methyltransferase